MSQCYTVWLADGDFLNTVIYNQIHTIFHLRMLHLLRSKSQLIWRGLATTGFLVDGLTFTDCDIWSLTKHQNSYLAISLMQMLNNKAGFNIQLISLKKHWKSLQIITILYPLYGLKLIYCVGDCLPALLYFAQNLQLIHMLMNKDTWTYI